MNFKSKKKTKLTSLRIEEDLLIECKKRGINISYAVNLFLQKYLYIQKYDKDVCPVIGSEKIDFNSLKIDIYDERRLLYV